MKILSSFTHPQVVPNLYECLCSAEHKGRYSEEWGKQSSSGAPLTSIAFFSYYGSQWCPKTAWLQTFFKISSFVFGRTKKFIQVWNYLRMSKWWQNFHFWVNYLFNNTVCRPEVHNKATLWGPIYIYYIKKWHFFVSCRQCNYDSFHIPYTSGNVLQIYNIWHIMVKRPLRLSYTVFLQWGFEITGKK